MSVVAVFLFLVIGDRVPGEKSHDFRDYVQEEIEFQEERLADLKKELASYEKHRLERDLADVYRRRLVRLMKLERLRFDEWVKRRERPKVLPIPRETNPWYSSGGRY